MKLHAAYIRWNLNAGGLPPGTLRWLLTAQLGLWSLPFPLDRAWPPAAAKPDLRE